MSSLAGESLACGHLGMVSKIMDLSTAKACTERQLRLARTLHDERGKEDAYFQVRKEVFFCLGSMEVSCNGQGAHLAVCNHSLAVLLIQKVLGARHSNTTSRCADSMGRLCFVLFCARVKVWMIVLHV